MAFKDIFNDKNDINEKTVVGFASFAIMTIFALVDLTTGYFGKDLVINEFIYDSFLFITLGSFGIAEIGNVEAELVSDVLEIPAGGTFWIALRQKIRPNWHTYWRNPGG